MSVSPDSSSDLLVEQLTRREREVLALLAEGLAGPKIAQRLTPATSAVKTHIQHLYCKLGVNSKRQAVRLSGRLSETPTGAN